MKNTSILITFVFLFAVPGLFAQTEPAAARASSEFLEAQEWLIASASGLCPADPCPCSGGFREMQIYYFGEDNVNIQVFANKLQTTLITTFPNASSGQLLTISGAAQPGGELPSYIYLRVTGMGGNACTTPIYSRCPSNAWPGALEDLRVIGKTFGDFTVYAHRDSGNDYLCTLDGSNVAQDWRVGGNVVGPAHNTLGTLNNENVVFITNNTARGVISNTGNFGLGTTAPAARLDVAGDAHISQTLDVDGAATVGGNLTVEAGGLARIQNNTASNAANQGALVVSGGAGIGQNLNVANNIAAGNNLDVNGNAFVTGKLAVGTILIPGNHKVYVDGSVLATEVKVALTANWPDYVFADAYAAPDLELWEQFIRTRGHLPGIPSAAQVAQSGGIELGEMNRLLLEKIEQLTLISIQQQKEIARLKAQVEGLEQQRH